MKWNRIEDGPPEKEGHYMICYYTREWFVDTANYDPGQDKWNSGYEWVHPKWWAEKPALPDEAAKMFD